jgi:hypothetical protein
MKIVTALELNQYRTGTVFCQFHTLHSEGNCDYPASFGEFEVIVEKSEAGEIVRTRPLFDVDCQETMDGLKVGDEANLSFETSSSCAGCHTQYDKEIYAVFTDRDFETALAGVMRVDSRES